MNRMALALLGALLVAGCGGSPPERRTRVVIARELLHRNLGPGLGKPSTGYCRPQTDGTLACVMRTPKGRVYCVVSLTRQREIEGTYCNRAGG